MAVPAFISGWLPPAPVSTFGARIDQMYYFILWITGIIFVLTESALIYFSIRYRRQMYSGLLQLAIDAQMIAAKSASAKDSYAQARVGEGHRRL